MQMEAHVRQLVDTHHIGHWSHRAIVERVISSDHIQQQRREVAQLLVLHLSEIRNMTARIQMCFVWVACIGWEKCLPGGIGCYFKVLLAQFPLHPAKRTTVASLRSRTGGSTARA